MRSDGDLVAFERALRSLDNRPHEREIGVDWPPRATGATSTEKEILTDRHIVVGTKERIKWRDQRLR